MMTTKERERVLLAYRARVAQFNEIATRRAMRCGVSAAPETVPSVEEEKFPALSAREVDVLTLVASGCSNGEVAGRLFIAEETVKTHVRHVLGKLQARNRAHAVSIGFQRGLIKAFTLN
jgi:ATP/maltotriose-dependent transcriptional regulator MalT